MSFWQKVCAVLVVLLQGISSSISYMEESSLGESWLLKVVAFQVSEHKGIATFLTAVLAGLGVIFTVYFIPHRTRKAYRESLVDGLYEQVLDNDRTKARVTIFDDAGWFRTRWYRAKDLYGLIRYRNNSWSEAMSYIKEAYYIKIRYRWGTEFPKSRTYFCVSRQTAERCQGVAGKVRKQESNLTIKLPNIEGLDLSDENNLDPKVMSYMEEGHIGNIYLLRQLNRPAPFIYAGYVSTNGGKKIYVLVIDSWAEQFPFTGRVVVKTLSAYTKQLSTALDTRS